MSQSDSLDDLITRLTEKSWVERRSVVSQLAALGDAATAAIADVLASKRDDETRLASAVEALVQSSGDVDGVLLPLLASTSNPAVMCDCLAVLGRRRSKRAVSAIEAKLSHPDGNVSLAAIEALGRIGGGAGLTSIISVVQQRDFFRTFPSIEVLGKSRDHRAVPTLIDLLLDPLYASAAARSLGDARDARATEALLRTLLQGDEALADASTVALAAVARAEPDAFRAQMLAASSLPALQAKLAASVERVWPLAALEEKEDVAFLLSAVGGQRAAAMLLSYSSDEELATLAMADALRALGRAGDGPLLEIIDRGSSAHRTRFLPLIGGAPNGITAVVACLDDPDAEVRALAADTLARLGQPTAVEALFQHLTDPNARVVQACIAAIQALGSAQTETLALAAAKSRDAGVRHAAYRIIGYMGYPAGLPVLIAAASSDDAKDREAALPGLAYMEDVRATTAILAAARHDSPRTRAIATRVIGERESSKEAIALLATALTDDDAWVRYYACQSAGRLQAETLGSVIVARLNDGAGQVRVAAIEALGKLKDAQARAALEHATHSSDLDVRRAAIVGLGSLQDRGSVGLLLEQARSDDASIRLMALSSIAKFDDVSVLRALRRAAFDADSTVASAAIALLGRRGDSASVQALISMLEQRELVEQVQQALVSDERHIEPLAAALDTAGRERSLLFAHTLMRFRSNLAESALREALLSPNVEARRSAAAALATSTHAATRDALSKAAREDSDPEVRARAAGVAER